MYSSVGGDADSITLLESSVHVGAWQACLTSSICIHIFSLLVYHIISTILSLPLNSLHLGMFFNGLWPCAAKVLEGFCYILFNLIVWFGGDHKLSTLQQLCTGSWLTEECWRLKYMCFGTTGDTNFWLANGLLPLMPCDLCDDAILLCETAFTTGTHCCCLPSWLQHQPVKRIYRGNHLRQHHTTAHEALPPQPNTGKSRAHFS